MSDKATDKRPQFFLIEDAVVTDFDLDPYTGWLYVVIVKHADRKTGDAFPGIARLSKLCKMSRSQVVRSIKVLEEKHLIEVKRDTKPFKGEKRQREVNHYQVLSAGGSVYQELGVVSTSDYPSSGEKLGVVSGVDRNKNQSKPESTKTTPLVLDMPTDVNKWSELNLNTYYGQHRADLKVMAVALAINIDTVPWENWTLSERRNVIKRHRFIVRDGLDVSAYTHYLMNEFHWRQPCRLNLSDYDNNVSKYKTALIKSTARPRVPIPLHDEPIQPVENITPEERQRMADESRAAFLAPRQAVVNE